MTDWRTLPLRVYNDRPITTIERARVRGHLDGMKPAGFWFTVDGPDDWRSWCISEGFRLPALSHVHELVLRPDARILLVSTVEELDAFHDEYAISQVELLGPVPRYHDDPEKEHRLREFAAEKRYIDWPRVAERYQGIIIAPYQWERRLDGSTFWYYGWDCASGVVWDTTTIDRVTLIRVDAVPSREVDAA